MYINIMHTNQRQTAATMPGKQIALSVSRTDDLLSAKFRLNTE